jgi:predicted outer membrane protein
MRLVHHAIGACAAILAVTAVPACSGEEQALESQSDVSRANIGVAGANIGDPLYSLCSEAEALSVLRALNMGEIAILQAARDQLRSRELQSLVDQLIEEHTQLHAATEAAAQAANVPSIDSPVANSLMLQSKRAIRDIGGTANVDVDRQFVADQILSHVAGIGLIDRLVLPSVRDPRLAMVVMRARMLMMRHARHAFRMQAALEPPCHERLPMPVPEGRMGRPSVGMPGQPPVGMPGVGLPRGRLGRQPVEIPGPMGGPAEGVGEEQEESPGGEGPVDLPRRPGVPSIEHPALESPERLPPQIPPRERVPQRPSEEQQETAEDTE